MVTIGMYYEVIPGKESFFEERFVKVVDLLNAGFAGHKQTYLYRRCDDPASYAIISEWENREGFSVFMKSDAFRQTVDWGKEEVLRGRPRHQVYQH